MAGGGAETKDENSISSSWSLLMLLCVFAYAVVVRVEVGVGGVEVKEEWRDVGALDMIGKTVKDAMTPINDVFMLPDNIKLTPDTIAQVLPTLFIIASD